MYILFVEEASDRRKASLSSAKRKAEESTEEAESAEAAQRVARANERPTTHARLEDPEVAGEKTEVEGATSIVPP
jgi:hypothetical protein